MPRLVFGQEDRDRLTLRGSLSLGSRSCLSARLPYVDPAQLAPTMEEFQSEGLKAVNTRTFGVHRNEMKPIDDNERDFKMRMDPNDLLNSGNSTRSTKGALARATSYLPLDFTSMPDCSTPEHPLLP
jgi:hypothetical protein